MTFLKKLWPGILAAILAVTPVVAAERAIIVLDGSGSMWAQIDGVARITIARDTLQTVLGTLPEGMELGFMTYGHREKGACDDIELMVPPAAGTAQAIIDAAATINPKGKTPISDAVRLATEELRYTEEKATVILITDGLETCEADPCALASELEQSGIDFTTHVLGFGLTDEEGQQVACLAENTGGKYLGANDAAALTEALTATVEEVAQAEPVAEPEPEPVVEPEPEEPAAPEFNLLPEAVMAEGGEVLTSDDLVWELYKVDSVGGKGEHVSTNYYSTYKDNIPPGDYIMRAGIGHAYVEQPLTIEAGKVAKPYFVLNAGMLIVRPLPSEGAEPDPNAGINIAYPGPDQTTYYGPSTVVLPAGELTVTVTVGEGEVVETIQLAAGETVERDIVVGVGHVTFNASYVEDMRIEDGNLALEVFKAKERIDGTREQLLTTYGPDSGQDLPPGDYVARLSLDQANAEVPFTVVSGERSNVEAVLDAGVLAITAPGASSIEVFGAKKDIQGDRKGFGIGYEGVHQTTLPAGDYVIVTSYAEGEPKETPTTVVAGERNELTVE